MKFLAVLLCFFMPLGESSAQEIHPDFLSLKKFRTYLSIDHVEKPTHTFWIHYFDDGFGNEIKISSPTIQESRTAKPFPGGFVAGSLPLPEELPGNDVPVDLKPLADSLIVRAKEILGNQINKVTIRYLGVQGYASITERIFNEVPQVGQRVFMTRGSYTLFINEDLSSFEYFPSGGVGDTIFPDDLSGQAPRFVDFVMPSDLEGTLALGAKLFYENDAIDRYASVYDDAQQAVEKTVRSILKGSYTSPLVDILARQGPLDLPSDSKQQVVIVISSYLHTDSGTNSDRSELSFGTQDLLAGAVTRTVKQANGFTTTLTIDLANDKLSYQSTDPFGNVENIELKIESFVSNSGNNSYLSEPADILHPTSAEWDATSIRFEGIGPNRTLSGLVSISDSIRIARVHRKL